MSTTTRQQAEHALWDYLNGPWAKENRKWRNHPTRALQALAPAMQKGTLLHDMTSWLAGWKLTTITPQFKAMVEMTWLGVRTWEEVLLMPGKPWSPFITVQNRRDLHRVIAECRKAASTKP